MESIPHFGVILSPRLIVQTPTLEGYEFGTFDST
jgi:hypothetical protein